MPTKHKKISQKQNVKQTVIIKLDREGKKVRVKRRRIKKYPTEANEGYDIMTRQLPPPVIYQSSYQIPVPVFPEPEKPKTINAIPVAKPFIEDIGQVGTEGPVEILPVPTKREQLKDLITPVPKPSFYPSEDYPVKPPPREPIKQIGYIEEENIRFKEKMDKAKNLFASLKEPIVPLIEPLVRTRRGKKEMGEARQMEREDIASINLGLSQFEPSFQKTNIAEKLPTETSVPEMKEKERIIPEVFRPSFTEPQIQEQIPSPSPNVFNFKRVNIKGKPIESLITETSITVKEKEKRKQYQTWKYWRNQYRENTGKSISLNNAKKIGTLDEFINYVKESHPL